MSKELRCENFLPVKTQVLFLKDQIEMLKLKGIITEINKSLRRAKQQI